MRWSMRSWVTGLAALVMAAGGALPASALTLKLAGEYGISYLPLTVMQTQHLLQKLGRQQGLDITTKWLQFTGGAAMDEALIAGDLNIAVGGVAPMVLLWARTQDNLR
ncbi:MAG: ABC transporter substrate-binding protein, partial [Acetobacteraceae bacterium]